MNAVTSSLLALAILLASGVYAVKSRYTVIQDNKVGTLIIDNWDFKTTTIFEKHANGNWVGLDVVKGGPSVVQSEDEMKVKKTEDSKPVI